MDGLRVDLSIIVPIHNERQNIPLLYGEIVQAIEPLNVDFEIVYIDDGSTDGSDTVLKDLAATDARLTVVTFRRNYGQTAAMQAGLEAAIGNVLVTIDGDLQNDPADIPRMLNEIENGCDLVHGWRKDRKDKWLSRRLPSLLANRLISRVTGFPIHDLGCTLKVMRREIADELELYGEMHRFIPILAHARGAECVEIVTNHRARQFGKTKYGISRTVRVVLDLITVKYMLDFFDSPMKLFGRFGLACCAAATCSASGLLLMKWGGVDMTGNPLLMLTVLCAILGVQFFSLGLIGEVSARLYYGRNHRRPFAIRTIKRSSGNDQQTLPTVRRISA
jgi:glycosyltransferase involved in cell wall biosynthesis